MQFLNSLSTHLQEQIMKQQLFPRLTHPVQLTREGIWDETGNAWWASARTKSQLKSIKLHPLRQSYCTDCCHITSPSNHNLLPSFILTKNTEGWGKQSKSTSNQQEHYFSSNPNSPLRYLLVEETIFLFSQQALCFLLCTLFPFWSCLTTPTPDGWPVGQGMNSSTIPHTI